MIPRCIGLAKRRIPRTLNHDRWVVRVDQMAAFAEERQKLQRAFEVAHGRNSVGAYSRLVAARLVDGVDAICVVRKRTFRIVAR